MTDPMTTQSAGAPSLPELPKPAIPVVYAPAGGFVPTPRSETVTISMPQPYFTADQMNAHYLKGYEAGSAAAAQAVPEGFVLVPREPTFEMNKAGQEAVWDFHPDDTIEGNEETARAAYFAMLDAAPTQGAEGAAPQAVVGEAGGRGRQFIYDDHVRPEQSGDDESFEGLSWYDFGASRQHPCVINARGRTALKDGDWIVKIGTQYHAFTQEVYALLTPSPTPTAPQEADALREALKLALKALEAIGDEMTVGERYTNAGQYLLDALEPARAALAQHQPQQGEQHE